MSEDSVLRTTCKLLKKFDQNFSFYDLLAFIISDNKGTQHFQKK